MNEAIKTDQDEVQEEAVKDSVEDGIAEVAEQKAEGPEVIQLEGDLGIAQIDGLYAQLGATLKQATKIEIDAAGLNQVDSAAVQLLYAFVNETKGRGIVLTWKSSSEPLKSAADQLGLTALMGL